MNNFVTVLRCPMTVLVISSSKDSSREKNRLSHLQSSCQLDKAHLKWVSFLLHFPIRFTRHLLVLPPSRSRRSSFPSSTPSCLDPRLAAFTRQLTFGMAEVTALSCGRRHFRGSSLARLLFVLTFLIYMCVDVSAFIRFSYFLLLISFPSSFPAYTLVNPQVAEDCFLVAFLLNVSLN